MLSMYSDFGKHHLSTSPSERISLTVSTDMLGRWCLSVPSI